MINSFSHHHLYCAAECSSSVISMAIINFQHGLLIGIAQNQCAKSSPGDCVVSFKCSKGTSAFQIISPGRVNTCREETEYRQPAAPLTYVYSSHCAIHFCSVSVLTHYGREVIIIITISAPGKSKLETDSHVLVYQKRTKVPQHQQNRWLLMYCSQ